MALIGAGLTYLGIRNRCPLGGSCEYRPKKQLTVEQLEFAKKCRENRHLARLQRNKLK